MTEAGGPDKSRTGIPSYKDQKIGGGGKIHVKINQGTSGSFPRFLGSALPKKQEKKGATWGSALSRIWLERQWSSGRKRESALSLTDWTSES